jgi:hypothetical protein
MSLVQYKEELSNLNQYCSGDRIEKNEMCGSCGMYGGEERCMQSFGVET